MKGMMSIAAAATALAACTQQGPSAGNRANAESAQRPSDKESLAYIDKQDRAWAEDAIENDPMVLETILADDYSGVGDDGTIRNKAEEIRYWAALPPDASADPPKMTYRQYGDTVLAQGNQLLHPKGAAPVRILWTDVWMYRDGKWQVAGSQNATVPAKG